MPLQAPPHRFWSSSLFADMRKRKKGTRKRRRITPTTDRQAIRYIYTHMYVCIYIYHRRGGGRGRGRGPAFFSANSFGGAIVLERRQDFTTSAGD